MKVLVNSEIPISDWSNFVYNNEFASPFQTFEFWSFINSIKNNKAIAIALLNENKIVALCVITIQKELGIKSFFSRRAIIYGGPIIEQSTDSKNNLSLLLEEINQNLRKLVIYAEIRNSYNYDYFKDIFYSKNWIFNEHLNFKIDTRNITLETILAKMNYNRRREIKISIKESAEFKEVENDVELSDLYIILKDLYKKRVKLPLPSLEYFKKLNNSEIGKTFIIKHNNKIIGGSFCIYHKASSINTLYYCGIREYNKKIFPTHLAILAAIKYAIDNKLKFVDLMGAGKPNQSYGVRNYKSEFGGDMVEYGRFIKLYKPLLFKFGKFGIELLKRIK